MEIRSVMGSLNEITIIDHVLFEMLKKKLLYKETAFDV
jgi:hypothetical protein